MNMRASLIRVPMLASAVVLASAIGMSTFDVQAGGCVVSRLDSGDTVIDLSRGHACDEAASGDAVRGRPGMRLLKD